jgi:hypothetical protein
LSLEDEPYLTYLSSSSLPLQLWLRKTINVPGLAGKYQWREFPVVITEKYRPWKYSKFYLKTQVGNMIFRCD